MIHNVAVIDKYKSRINYKNYFDFDFDEFHLCENNKKRVLKKDITLNTTNDELKDYFDIDSYAIIILVGAEPCKHIGKITSVVSYQGYLTYDKFIPLTNPSMLVFKPEGKSAFNKACANIHDYVYEELKPKNNLNLELIDKEEDALDYLTDVLNSEVKIIGVDTETTSLYQEMGIF